ncbi:hypothetical protein ABW21_db0202069 [Orbilia brochopaga]|nr:hypothetical protein ABW21_db0202069 [Drechslerella brochopaga]
MSLFSEGQAILKLFKQPPKVDEKQSEPVVKDATSTNSKENKEESTGESETKETKEEPQGEQPAEETTDATPDIEVKMLKVQVTDGKTAKPLISGVDQAAFRQFVERTAGPSLTPGALPTFDESRRKLASLETSWATNASEKEYTEPADLTEQQWDRVLSNNRALHGYYYSGEHRAIMKAPKKAFKIRSNQPKEKTPTPPITEGEQTEGQVATEKPLPTIPPFYVSDDAEITITEISHSFQKTMLKEGFSSVAIEANASFKIPVSVSASWEQEQSTANQSKTDTEVKSLAATYNFPRVGVELDSEALELTDECKADAFRITDEDGVDRFYRKYGTIFATSFTLGGFLYSTRDVTTEETSTLAQVKNKTRAAAGLSIQSPYGGGGGNVAKTNADGTTVGTVSLNQEVRLAWNARGGDTLLCSNPPAWAATVKDYRLWRLMKQQRFVGIQYLIQDIDTHVYKQLTNPKAISVTDKKDITKDEDYSDRLIAGLLEALKKPEQNVLAQRVAKLYSENFANLDDFNNFCVTSMDDPNSVITSGTDWNKLSNGKKAMFGLWLYHVDKLERPAM